MNKNILKKGYTLLFAIIVASIVLSIAAFILSASRKQFILSSAARDSTVAIYAADSGIQCAVEGYNHHDIPGDFEGDLASGTPLVGPRPMVCNDLAVPRTYTTFAPSPDLGLFVGRAADGTDYVAYRSSEAIYPLANNTCAIVVIYDGYDTSNAHSHKLIIESRGYNIANSGPCAAGTTANPRAVERTIRLYYRD